MDDFNVWGQPIKGRKKKQSNIFGGSLDMGFGSSTKKKLREILEEPLIQLKRMKFWIIKRESVRVLIVGIKYC